MTGEPVHCLVEIPNGSRNKYTRDEDLGGIELDRLLFTSVVYPTDSGFIPGTCSPEGTPRDSIDKMPEGEEGEVQAWEGRERAVRLLDEARAAAQ